MRNKENLEKIETSFLYRLWFLGIETFDKAKTLLQKKPIRLSLQFIILLACGFYLSNTYLQTKALITDLEIDYLKIIGSILLTLISVFIGATSWWLIILGLGHDTQWIVGARVHVLSNLAKYMPGFAWQLIGKAYLTRKLGIKNQVVGAGMVIELVQLVLTGLLTAAALVPNGLFNEVTGQSISSTVLDIIRFSVILFAVCFLSIFPFVVRRIYPLLMISIRNFLMIWLSAVVILLGWIIYGISFWLIGNSLQPIPFTEIPLYVFTLAISLIIGLAIIFIPGSIGVRESIIVAILNPYMGGSHAVLIAMLARVVIVISEVLSSGILEASIRIIRMKVEKPSLIPK